MGKFSVAVEFGYIRVFSSRSLELGRLCDEGDAAVGCLIHRHITIALSGHPIKHVSDG